MRFVLIFIFVALPCLDTYGITKVYNIIDRKLKIHTYEPLTVDQKKKIEKKIDQILDVLNEYDSSTFISRFNNLEKNSEVSAPDIFVDAYKVLNDFNKITKGKFNPTAHTLLDKSQKVKKLDYYLKSEVHSRCTIMTNIKIKINNVFSKKQKCTKLSFDSIIKGIIIDNLRNYLISQNLDKFAITFDKIITKYNYPLKDSEFIELPKYIFDQINFNLISSYSVYTLDENLYTFNLNMKDNELAIRDDLIIIVATNSNSNNDILANTLNLMDIDKLLEEDNLNQNFPLFISFENDNIINFKYSKKFEDFLK